MVSANHRFGQQFSAQAQYHVRHGDAVGMIEVDRCDKTPATLASP